MSLVKLEDDEFIKSCTILERRRRIQARRVFGVFPAIGLPLI